MAAKQKQRYPLFSAFLNYVLYFEEIYGGKGKKIEVRLLL